MGLALANVRRRRRAMDSVGRIVQVDPDQADLGRGPIESFRFVVTPFHANLGSHWYFGFQETPSTLKSPLGAGFSSLPIVAG